MLETINGHMYFFPQHGVAWRSMTRKPQSNAVPLPTCPLALATFPLIEFLCLVVYEEGSFPIVDRFVLPDGLVKYARVVL